MSINHPSDTDLDAVWRLHRPYLIDLAFRMLGNIHDAEDVVQVAFSRLMHLDLSAIEEVRGWLNVVVSRLCLDQLRSARSRHEAAVATLDDGPRPALPAPVADPADRVTLDDSLRLALLVVLEHLSPPERAVFVLHRRLPVPLRRGGHHCRPFPGRQPSDRPPGPPADSGRGRAGAFPARVGGAAPDRRGIHRRLRRR